MSLAEVGKNISISIFEHKEDERVEGWDNNPNENDE